MTLVMVWSDAPDRWWLISDSRISGSCRPLTDSGAKILEIPATLYAAPSLDPPKDYKFGDRILGTPIRKTTLGFAFAGSVLVALNAYAAVLPLWSRLQSSPFDELPSVREFADHLAYFVGEYFKQVEQRCQCVLVGLDQGVGPLDGYIIDTHLADASTTVRRIDKPEEIPMVGSGSAIARVWLDGLKGVTQHWRREPLTFLKYLISKELEPTVGGAVQIGLLNAEGFEVFHHVHFKTLDDEIPSFDYRGFDMMKASKVGRCLSIMRGISE